MVRSFVINPPVFVGAVAITSVFVVIGAVLPDHAEAIFAAVQGWILASFGWLYLLAVAIFVAAVTFFAVSRFGNLKLRQVAISLTAARHSHPSSVF